MTRTRFPLLLRSGIGLLLLSASSQAQLPPTSGLPTLPPTATPLPAAPVPAAPLVAPAVQPAPMATAPALPTPAPAPAAPPGAPAATVLPDVSVMKTDAISMGPLNFSLLFTPNQVHAMRDALTGYETSAHNGTPVVSDLIVVEKPKIVEPANYPVFYLSSIVYRAPGDWSLWVSGHKITAQNNPTSLRVIAVSADQASFVWAPTYADALAKRYNEHLFANADPVKNKAAKPASFQYDQGKGLVIFTLKPNQSFVPAYFNAFEGYLESPALPAIEPLKAEVTAAPVAVAPAAPTPPSSPESLVPQQKTMQQSIQDITSRLHLPASKP